MSGTWRGALWPLRRPASGAESLEFAVCLLLLLMVLVTGVRVIEALRLQARADEDARALARQAAVCARPGAAAITLRDVDGSAPTDSRFAVDRSRDPLVTVTVAFPAVSVVGLSGASSISWTPRGSVTMRREPGC